MFGMKRQSFLIVILFSQLGLLTSAQHVYTIYPAKTYQTLHGFGASDAWSNNVLNLWNDSIRNLAADWLFSKEKNPDGSFKGIGLSVWRFNLGAGSSEQGDSSYIGNPDRRTESFLNSDGTYNFSKQSGTQGLLKAAKRRGVENLIMFSNSPPVSLTRNGKAFADVCGISNLLPANYEAFAGYITQSLKYFEREKIHFDYISPVNEPEWGWSRDDGQEGNPYLNIETAGLVKKINQKFIENQLSVRIQVPESGLLVFATISSDQPLSISPESVTTFILIIKSNKL
jgi:O-glycosyl hydrolase